MVDPLGTADLTKARGFELLHADRDGDDITDEVAVEWQWQSGQLKISGLRWGTGYLPVNASSADGWPPSVTAQRHIKDDTLVIVIGEHGLSTEPREYTLRCAIEGEQFYYEELGRVRDGWTWADDPDVVDARRGELWMYPDLDDGDRLYLDGYVRQDMHDDAQLAVASKGGSKDDGTVLTADGGYFGYLQWLTADESHHPAEQEHVAVIWHKDPAEDGEKIVDVLVRRVDVRSDMDASEWAKMIQDG